MEAHIGDQVDLKDESVDSSLVSAKKVELILEDKDIIAQKRLIDENKFLNRLDHEKGGVAGHKTSK